ncbi:MAG: HK97 family phage prohead protease, partial [Thermoflexales bacterium]|nr:HK97 family phage prohead protease [Thermoflexales bacterium]
MSEKRNWTAEERRKLAEGEIDGAFAGPDQSYPIAGPSDVADAWSLAGHAENPDAVRRRIIAIAKRFGWVDALPASAREWADEHGISLKIGRRLSAKQLQRLQEARDTIEDILSWAYYQDAPETDDEGGVVTRTTHHAVKSLGSDRIGGYAVLWGSEKARDLTGEFFTPETAELTAIFDALKRLPCLYHHGADIRMASNVAGIVDIMRADDVGLWYEAQLTLSGEYREALDRLISDGVLGTSSGTLPAARRVDRRSGRITRWPIVELSLTPTPAEPRMIEVP